LGNGRSCLTGAYCRWGISERQPATARYFYPLLWGLLYRTRQHTGQLDWQQLRRIESSANLTRVGTDSRPQHQRRQGYVDDLDKVPIPNYPSVARRSTDQLDNPIDCGVGSETKRSGCQRALRSGGSSNGRQDSAVPPGTNGIAAGRLVEVQLIASEVCSELLHKVPRRRAITPASNRASFRQAAAAAGASGFATGAAAVADTYLPYCGRGAMLRYSLQPRTGVVPRSSIVTGRSLAAGNLTTRWSGRDRE
jgi:hypothetical protein